MAETEYIYSIANDTLDGTALASCLYSEILESDLSDPGVNYVLTDGDELKVYMVDVLDSSDSALLDAIVAAHSYSNCSDSSISPSTIVYNGGLTEIRKDSYQLVSWGERRVHGSLHTLNSGEIFAITAHYGSEISNGAIYVYPVIDYIAQNNTGEFLELDSSNGAHRSLLLNSPLAYSADAHLNIFVMADGLLDPSLFSLTVTLYTRDI
jgi:predicted glycosyl hydrolase (DUF1957 family)